MSFLLCGNPCGDYREFCFQFQVLLSYTKQLSEDDYNSIDGILNNGARRETDPSRTDNETNASARKSEVEKESVIEKLREHEERLRNSTSEQICIRKDTICPDRELC